MALGRTYTVTSALVTLASTAQTPILAAKYSTTVTLNVEAIRIGIYSGAGVSYPSNGTVQCLLARATAAYTGGNALTPSPHNNNDIAAQSSWADNSTALVGIGTPGVTLWGQVLPFTAGANWGEWVTPGAEWFAGGSATTGLAFYLTCSSAGTATQFQIEATFTE